MAFWVRNGFILLILSSIIVQEWVVTEVLAVEDSWSSRVDPRFLAVRAAEMLAVKKSWSSKLTPRFQAVLAADTKDFSILIECCFPP